MDNVRGILFMVLAMAGFAISDGFLKELTQTLPTGQLLAIFGLTGGAILGAFARIRGARLIGPWLTSPIFVARLLSDTFAAVCIVSAFATAPLSLVSAIIQVSPLMAAAFAAWLLRETLGPRRILAILIGLVGVLIILEPWGAAIAPGMILAAIGAALLAMRDVLTRKMPADVPSDALVTYGFLAIAPGGLLLLAFDPVLVPMDGRAILLSLAGVLTGIFGYTMITLASRMAEISAIAPFRYTRLVFAILIGSIAFGERLSATALAGAALVIGSGLFVFWREARLRRA
ncbi:MAG: DMT family transporter [Pseudomonadota bacterium]